MQRTRRRKRAQGFKHIPAFPSRSEIQHWADPDHAEMRRACEAQEHVHMMERSLIIKTTKEINVPRDFADWREIPSETLERKEVREKLAERLASLGDKYREILCCATLQHCSIEAPPKTLGVTTASVKDPLCGRPDAGGSCWLGFDANLSSNVFGKDQPCNPVRKSVPRYRTIWIGVDPTSAPVLDEQFPVMQDCPLCLTHPQCDPTLRASKNDATQCRLIAASLHRQT